MTSLRLPDLYVKESHRNAGIGKAMFGYLGKVAKDNDYGRLDWSVLKVSRRYILNKAKKLTFERSGTQ